MNDPIVEGHYELYPKRPTMEVYTEISLRWKIQIYNEVVRRFAGLAMVFGEEAVDSADLFEEAVVQFADIVIKENNDNAQQAADILKISITEHLKTMFSMAIHQNMKMNGTTPTLTKAIDQMIESFKSNNDPINIAAKLNNAAEFGTFPEGDAYIESTNAKDSLIQKPIGDYDGDSKVIIKRKKSKKRSKHVPNCKSVQARAVMGARILSRLGGIQQKHLDHTKHQLLQELPLADLVEVAGGEKIPAYQANLLNSMQAKADPKAPVVQRFVEETQKTSQSTVGEVNPNLDHPELQELTIVGNDVVDRAESAPTGELGIGRGLINSQTFIACDEFGNPI